MNENYIYVCNDSITAIIWLLIFTDNWARAR